MCKKLNEIMHKKNLFIPFQTYVEDKNTNEKVTHKIVNKTYFEDQFEGANMPNYAERVRYNVSLMLCYSIYHLTLQLVRLNSRTDEYLKIIDYLKKK